jgi:micrococcal nuclease
VAATAHNNTADLPTHHNSRFRPDAVAVAGNTAAHLRTYHDKSFKVHVIDGDTLDIDVRDEVLGKDVTRIRLWGVDTPETVGPNTPKQHFGPEAARFTKDLCIDKTVRLELAKGHKTRDRYGRLLAYVFIAPTAGKREVCLNIELIRQGYGYADPRFAHPRKVEFRNLQRLARKNRVGLWADARIEDLPYYYRGKIKPGQ